MTKINHDELYKRDFIGMTEEFVPTLRRMPIVWSWGARDWTKMNEGVLRFKVSGRLHEGYVYLSINFMDLFRIDLTDGSGKIVTTEDDIYVDTLIEVLDKLIETK